MSLTLGVNGIHKFRVPGFRLTAACCGTRLTIHFLPLQAWKSLGDYIGVYRGIWGLYRAIKDLYGGIICKDHGLFNRDLIMGLHMFVRRSVIT